MTWTPDTWMLRTTGPDGRSYNAFQWPTTVGAVVEAPDWDPAPRCGGGLHGLLEGLGDWSYLSLDPEALWWIVEVCRAEVVELRGKVKVPRGRIASVGWFEDILPEVVRRNRETVIAVSTDCRAAIVQTANSVALTEEAPGVALAAGYAGRALSRYAYAPAISTGEQGHAVTDGHHAPAVACGFHGTARTRATRAPAVALGYHGNAHATGPLALAAALGPGGQARAEHDGSWLVLASYEHADSVKHVRALLVGRDVEAGQWYRLDHHGEVVRVDFA